MLFNIILVLATAFQVSLAAPQPIQVLETREDHNSFCCNNDCIICIPNSECSNPAKVNCEDLHPWINCCALAWFDPPSALDGQSSGYYVNASGKKVTFADSDTELVAAVLAN